MTISTFSELKTAIADELNRDDLSTAVGRFIALAEADLGRRVEHWRRDVRVSSSVSSQYEALPDGFVSPISLSIATSRGVHSLKMASADWIAGERIRNADAAGIPTHYAMTAGQFEFYPTPSDTFTMGTTYRKALTPLSDGAPSNWILTYHPDAYLYGALVHSAPFLHEDARLQVWAALSQAAIAGINDEGRAAMFGGDRPVIAGRFYG